MRLQSTCVAMLHILFKPFCFYIFPSFFSELTEIKIANCKCKLDTRTVKIS